MEIDLKDLVARLRESCELNLQAVVLYGEAVDADFEQKHSDLNVLCLLRHANGSDLSKLRPIGLWWRRKGHPSLLVFTLEELVHSADIFAIELLDMKKRHRMLWGEDFLGAIEVPRSLHRFQIERELRITVVRLRQAFLSSRGNTDELASLMSAAVSSVVTLCRHSLMVLGEQPPESGREALQRVATLVGTPPSALLRALDFREARRRAGEVDIQRAFQEFLDGVARIAKEMDRRFAVA